MGVAAESAAGAKEKTVALVGFERKSIGLFVRSRALCVLCEVAWAGDTPPSCARIMCAGKRRRVV